MIWLIILIFFIAFAFATKELHPKAPIAVFLFLLFVISSLITLYVFIFFFIFSQDFLNRTIAIIFVLIYTGIISFITYTAKKW